MLSLKLICRTQNSFPRLNHFLLVINNTTNRFNSSLQTVKDNFKIATKEDFLNEDKPYIKQTTISSSCINGSEILQELFKLNVDLYKVEENEEAYEYILQRNFNDIKEYIIFLKKLDLREADIGNLITKNPLILKEDIEDLYVRINYLKYKKFSDDKITAIVQKNPFWLTYSTQKIDDCLGAIKNVLCLKDEEVRQLAERNSKVITYPLEKIKVNVFALQEEMGFTQDEMKQMVLMKPKVIMKGRAEMLKTFDYLHNSMSLSHGRIAQECMVLTCRESRLKPRHLFLSKLGRAQYDPKKPNYISLQSLISGNDSIFATEVAKSSVQTYNLFLKSL